MTSPKVQIEIAADAAAAKQEIASIGPVAEGMAEKVEASGKKAGKGIDNLGERAKKSADDMTRAERSMVQSIERATAAFSAGSKSSSDYYRVLAAQRGIDPAILEPYLAALDAVAPKQKMVTQALADTAPAMQKYEMSAKATAAALREVPAQVTDIVVGLQGGQKPLTVLLQQGGQLKDVFGGVVPAVRAVGGYLASILSPTTVLVGAVAAIAIAFEQGRAESEKLNKSLILTGNYAGATSDRLADMARAVSKASGYTVGASVDAINALAGSGRIGSQNMELFARAAVAMEKEAGQAVSDTVAKFVELGRAPVEASVKLNESMHYLTLETYNQIKALEDQGRSSQAAALAQQAYANAAIGATKNLHENLGLLEKGWRGVADAARNTWDAMLDVGRTETLDQKIARLTKKLADAAQKPDATQGMVYGLAQHSVDPKDAADLQNALEQRQRLAASTTAKSFSSRLVELKAQFDKELDGYDTQNKDAARIKERTKAEEAYGVLLRTNTISQKEYNQLIAGIDKKFTDTGIPAKQEQLAKARAALDIGAIQNAYAAQADAYTNGEKVLEALRAAGLVNDQDYYASKRAFLEAEAKAEDDALAAEIARARARQVIGATKLDRDIAQADKDKQIQDLLAKRTKAQTDAAAAVVALGIAEVAATNKITNAFEAATQAAQDYLDTTTRAQDRALEDLSHGSATNANRAEIARILDKFQTDRDTAQKKYLGSKRSEADTEDYREALAVANEYQDKELENQKRHADAMAAARSDWLKGAKRALEDYQTTASDIASSTASAFTNAFKGMEDALVQFAKTGKLDFSSLADSIISDLVRIQVQQNITKPLAAAGGDIGNFLSSIFKANKLGGVYTSPSLSAYSNGVYDTPRPFTFAKGAGIFAEAGPEAIMPLARGADGSLGVRAQGGAGDVTVHQPLIIHAPNAGPETVNQIRALMPALIAQNSKVVEGVVQAALQRRGRRL